MKFKAIMIAAALAGVSVASPAFAWETIGSRQVSERSEREVIAVPGHRRYERIKVCAARNPVAINELAVRYNNGARQDFDVRRRIAPGDCTRSIDLAGARGRDIRHVFLAYEQAGPHRGGGASVRVLAE